MANALNKAKNDKYKYIFAGRDKSDLTDEESVKWLFHDVKPDIVIHTAARVGGVGGNLAKHAEFFRENILMNTHVIHYSCKYRVQKLIAFSSLCSFPENLSTFREDLLHQGEPFQGNFAYAYAKRMVDIQIQAYKAQYGVLNYCSVIPGNIFGTHDYYNLSNGHVVPSLIYKIWLAKIENRPLYVWGDGTAKREFIFADDVARIIQKLIELETLPDKVIISGEKQYSIKELVETLCKAAKFTGEVIWDSTKPNGQKERSSDLSLLKSLVDLQYTDFAEALKISYDWFEQNYRTARY